MEPIFAIALFAFVFIVIATFMSTRDRINKTRIDEEIRIAGGEPVTISHRFFDFDQHNHTYDVHFTDDLGRKHETRCKVHVFGSDVYWDRSPDAFLADLPVEDTRWSHMKVSSNDSKEQIISDLAAENERLQQELARANRVNGAQKKS